MAGRVVAAVVLAAVAAGCSDGAPRTAPTRAGSDCERVADGQPVVRTADVTVGEVRRLLEERRRASDPPALAGVADSTPALLCLVERGPEDYVVLAAVANAAPVTVDAHRGPLTGSGVLPGRP